jgi:hypothetical protein
MIVRSGCRDSVKMPVLAGVSVGWPPACLCLLDGREVVGFFWDGHAGPPVPQRCGALGTEWVYKAVVARVREFDIEVALE